MNSKINLCDNCKHDFPSCKTKNITFGSGIGKDNIIQCEKFSLKNKFSFEDIEGKIVSKTF